MDRSFRILDIGFNAAVLTIANRTAGAFHVSDDAPQTYEQLIRHVETKRSITVWGADSQLTIYGDPEVNYAFRAWHLWCHWRGRHDFTLKGERATAHDQCVHIVTLYGDTPRTRYWRRIIEAEVIGQTMYRNQHGALPADQFAFVSDYLAQRVAA